MQIKPILSALRRHKAGTVLIALQIALTLAIVCNALFIIQQRVSHLSRPTGVDESNLMVIHNGWVGEDDVESRIRTDLATLRGLPGVVDVVATNSYPLRGGGWSMGARTDPEATKSITSTTLYFMDDHAIETLGLKLIAGRNFRPDEIRWMDAQEFDPPPQVIVSKALADKLYPDASAVGKVVYISDEAKPSTIVGIVEKLQVPWPGTWADNFVEHSTILPRQLIQGGAYLVRAQPGQLAALVKSAPKALYDVSRMRVIPPKRGVRTFDVVRAEAYKSDRGMAILMGVVCIVLLAITAAGIVGLTSFWVGQRRKQIGVRRALGATRNDILSYFLTENLLIGIGGVVVGAALAVGMNLWMMQQFEMQRLSLLYVAVGVIALLVLGQGAVLAPALRASRVPPVVATRTV